MGTSSWEPGLGTLLRNLVWEPVRGNLAWETLPGNLAWEPVPGNLAWRPMNLAWKPLPGNLGNLRSGILAAPTCSGTFTMEKNSSLRCWGKETVLLNGAYGRVDAPFLWFQELAKSS